MPRASPQDCRDDVVHIVRVGKLTNSQKAEDWVLAEVCVNRGVRCADEDGKCPGTCDAETTEMPERARGSGLLEIKKSKSCGMQGLIVGVVATQK